MNDQEKSHSPSKKNNEKNSSQNKKTGIVLLPLSCIKRLASQAGVKRLSANAIEDIRYVNLSFLTQLIHHAIALAQMQNRKVILPSDIFYATNRMGRTIIGPF